MKNKIIALIDTTDVSNNISNYIIEFAKNIEAAVTFCDIISVDSLETYNMQQPAIGMTGVAPIYKSKVKDMLAEAEKALQFTCDKFVNEWEFVDYEIVRGTDYISELRNLIKEKEANLLVTGRNESPNFLEKWLGNQTTMIADATNIPTLIVPQNYSFLPFQHLLHHIELKGRDMAKLKRTVQFAKLFDASVTATFFDTNKEYVNYKKRTSLLSKIARYPKLEFNYYEVENIQESLNTLTQEKGIDLIAMNYQDNNIIGRLFSRNYSDHLILSLEVPFMVY